MLKAGRFAGATCVSGLRPLLPSLDARPSCLTRGMSAKSPRLCRLSSSGQGRSRSPAPLQSTSLAGLWAVVTVWCVPSSPIAVICCGTGASAWVGQVETRCALTGRFTVLLGVDVPANHGAQQAVGQRLSALPRVCSPTARHIAQPIDIHKEAHNVAQRMRVLSFDSLRSALPCAAYFSRRRPGFYFFMASPRYSVSRIFGRPGFAFHKEAPIRLPRIAAPRDRTPG